MKRKEVKDVIKLIPIVTASPIGIILSIIVAVKLIDFGELDGILKSNLLSFKLIQLINPIIEPWFIWSLACFFFSFIFITIVFLIKQHKKENNDSINIFDSLAISISLILIIQILLPVMLAILGLVYLFIYLIFGISTIIKFILGYGVYFFAYISQSLFNSYGYSISLGDFIGDKKYNMLLTLIIFLIAVPYLLSSIIRVIKKVMTSLGGGSQLFELIFKPIEFIFKITHIRYIIYLSLFFLSIFVYSYNITDIDNVLMLFKESLLEYVLLDTICYSLYENLSKWNKRKKAVMFMRFIIPFKLDLEIIRASFLYYSFLDKSIKSKVKFSCDTVILKRVKYKEFNKIILELNHISNCFLEPQELYTGINNVLYRIYEYEYIYAKEN